MYNVLDGVDVYAVKGGGGSRRKPKQSFKLPKPPRTKHAVHVVYINDGSGIACGSTTGDVCVWDVNNSELYQTLFHDKNDILQAIAVRWISLTSSGHADA